MKIHPTPLRSILFTTNILLTPIAMAATALDVNLGPERNVGATITTAPFQQYQSDLRVDPNNPDRMVITLKNSNDETRTAAFHTLNGGLTWGVNQQPGSGDPDVVYDQNGTAFWTIINKSDSKKAAVLISKDGGVTWAGRVRMGIEAIDHAHSVVDRSPVSPFYNSVYLAGRTFSQAALGVIRTRNGGDTWDTSLRSLVGTAGNGFVSQPWVMRDGTLVVPVRSQNNILVENGSYAGNLVNTYSVRSTNGGVTFDAPVFVANRDSPKTTGSAGGANFADAGIVGGMWNGVERLYFVFAINPGNNTAPQIQLCTSDDAGVTWTASRKISPAPPSGKGYSIPSVMVNPDGVVGLQYFELSGDYYNVVFSASSDGGDTFSPPVRVSSATGKEVPFGQIPRELGGDQIFASGAADGSFRLVWTDNRDNDNLYSIYQRTVMVKPSDPGPGNQAPVSLSLIGENVTSGSPVGTKVGTLRTSEPDAGDTHTYSLVGGDAAKFRIVGNVLQTATIPNYSLAKSHTVIIRSTDSGGLSVQRSLDIAVHPVTSTHDTFGNVYFGDDQQGDAVQDGQNGTASSITVAPDRRGVRITGNAWKRFPLKYTVTAATILEFTVTSSDTGEFLGLILDSNTNATDDRRGILIGGSDLVAAKTSSWVLDTPGVESYTSGQGEKKYTIPVGTLFTGKVIQLVLVGNDDAGGGSTDATFSNIRIHQGIPPQSYLDWKASRAWGAIPQNLRDPDDDPDGDGRDNATERAFGGDPTASDPTPGTGMELLDANGSRLVKVFYRKGVAEMNYALQQSSTLVSWADVTNGFEFFDGKTGLHYRTWTPANNQTRGFTRIKATDL